MKSFVPRLVALFCSTFFIYQLSFAQAPVITVNTGMPSGTRSSRDIDYGNNIYVTILNPNEIYSSADGEVWSKVIDPDIPASLLTSITFGAGIFVAAGEAGTVLTSADGLDWTVQASATINDLNDVQYLQSAFYAAGVGRTLITSTDGINWITVSMTTGNSSDEFKWITYGNGAFALGAWNVGNNGMYIYRSETGGDDSWTYQDVEPGLTMEKLQFLNDRFFIFCNTNDIYTSTDANIWASMADVMTVTLENSDIEPMSNSNHLSNGIYDGTKFYFFGSASGTNSRVFSSTDGLNFTLEPQTAYIVCQESAYLNSKYFQVGNEGLVTSVDGLNYHYPTGNYRALASSGTNYVGVGPISESGIIFSSTDFNTWTQRTPAAQKPLFGVVYTGTKYVAAGSQTVVESINNGIDWTEVATPDDLFVTLAYGASVLVASGYDVNTFLYRIAYSSDGVIWTTANADNHTYYKIKFINGNFFATGYSNDTFSGVVLHSTDGINWTDITPVLPFQVYYFNDVVFDGSKYHFMGVELVDPVFFTMEFFSISTETIADPNSYLNKGTIGSPPPDAVFAGSFGEGGFIYSSGRIIGTANDMSNGNTYVIYSSDGINWTAKDANAQTYVYGAFAEGNKIRLLGSGDGKITAVFAAITLPISMVRFTASLVNGESVIDWETSTEHNSELFIVQHSTNAVNWHAIGKVMAAGESKSLRNYHFTHTSPQWGANYYRVIQVDIGGKQQIGPVKRVNTGKPIKARIYPNPATESVQLELMRSGTATVILFNANGQQVYRKVHSGNIIRLPVQKLPGGMYQVLVVYEDGERYSEQLFKQ